MVYHNARDKFLIFSMPCRNYTDTYYSIVVLYLINKNHENGPDETGLLSPQCINFVPYSLSATTTRRSIFVPRESTQGVALGDARDLPRRRHRDQFTGGARGPAEPLSLKHPDFECRSSRPALLQRPCLHDSERFFWVVTRAGRRLRCRAAANPNAWCGALPQRTRGADAKEARGSFFLRGKSGWFSSSLP